MSSVRANAVLSGHCNIIYILHTTYVHNDMCGRIGSTEMVFTYLLRTFKTLQQHHETLYNA